MKFKGPSNLKRLTWNQATTKCEFEKKTLRRLASKQGRIYTNKFLCYLGWQSFKLHSWENIMNKGVVTMKKLENKWITIREASQTVISQGILYHIDS